MLTSLSIRDIVLVEALDLEFGPGLTVLTGETGAGKSIILDALGLATGGRADGGLVRGGATQGVATAVFSPPADHGLWARLAETAIEVEPGEDLILRRQQGADGRSRAFINDQPVSIAALRGLGEHLIEVHGQHETVGLLDAKTHRGLLDDWADLSGTLGRTRDAWRDRASAMSALEALRAEAARAAGEADDLAANLAELERLDPREGEEADLAGERAAMQFVGAGGVQRQQLGGERCVEAKMAVRTHNEITASGVLPLDQHTVDAVQRRAGHQANVEIRHVPKPLRNGGAFVTRRRWRPP